MSNGILYIPCELTAETIVSIPIESYELLSQHVKIPEKQLEISQNNLKIETQLHANTQKLLWIRQKQVVLLNGTDPKKKAFWKKFFGATKTEYPHRAD